MLSRRVRSTIPPCPKARLQRVYSDEEVKAILSRAIDRQRAATPEGLSHDDLLYVARDAGISPEAIEAAAADLTASRSLEDDEIAVRKERLSNFRVHLFTYIPVIAFLVFANSVMTTLKLGRPGPRRSRVGSRARDSRRALRWPAFAADGHQQQAARRAARRPSRQRGSEARRAKRATSGGCASRGHAVERGVAVILTETAKRIHDEIGGAAEAPGRRVRVERGEKADVRRRVSEDTERATRTTPPEVRAEREERERRGEALSGAGRRLVRRADAARPGETFGRYQLS